MNVGIRRIPTVDLGILDSRGIEDRNVISVGCEIHVSIHINENLDFRGHIRVAAIIEVVSKCHHACQVSTSRSTDDKYSLRVDVVKISIFIRKFTVFMQS